MTTDILLVVLYNETIETSKTISSFLQNCSLFHDRIKLVIWDNSPSQMVSHEEQLSFSCKIEYFHSPENLPLSKIYNKIINANPQYNNIFIFDQDSYLEEKYFRDMSVALNKYPKINLFIPRILHGTKVMSPAKRFLHKGIYVYNPDIYGIMQSDKFIGIMSGMAIRLKIFRETTLRFDENLYLYGIDIKFSIDYSRQFTELYVLNYNLQHDLSMFANETIDIKNKRYKSQIEASKYISRNISLFAYFACLVAIVRRKLFHK